MKLAIVFRILPIILLGVVTAIAAPTKTKSKLETDVNFSDLTVQGKYQLADEANATVEDDKGLNDLLQPRKHFKDRLGQTAGRN
jgi:hypothetical protein